MTGLCVERPADLAALTALMADAQPVRFIAGGTDLLIAGRDLPDSGLLVDLGRVAELCGISTEGAQIVIGAATPVALLATHPGLAARLPALVQAAAEIGAVQIRNRATLGGNIANAAAAADLVPVLWAADARLALMLPGGALAEVAVQDWRPAPGVVILRVTVPEPSARSAFVKLGPRRALTIARLNLAAVAEFSEGRFGAVRLVAGALGPRPIRLYRAEAALAGQDLTPATLRALLAALTAEVDAAIPGRASQAWKRRAIGGLGLDLLASLAGLSPRDALFDWGA